ncbi:MAG: TRAP transporter small permease [Peptococcaceae bacterium]
MAGIKKALDVLEKLVVIGSIITFTIMIVMGILQVLFRYVFDSSLYFTEELARFMFIWAVFLASAICSRRQSHAAIELFVGWMPQKLRKIALIIASVCTIGFFVLIFVKGIELTIITWSQASPAMEISMGIIYLAIPVGGLLMLIFTIENLYAEFTNSPQIDNEGEVT